MEHSQRFLRLRGLSSRGCFINEEGKMVQFLSAIFIVRVLLHLPDKSLVP